MDVLKDAEADEVASAVRAAVRGEVHLDPAARTHVSTHVSNTLAKLGLASRTQAALWAVREGSRPHPHSGRLGPFFVVLIRAPVDSPLPSGYLTYRRSNTDGVARLSGYFIPPV